MVKRCLVVPSLLLALGAGCTHSSSVAVNPITNRISWTKDEVLKVCDQDLKNCQETRLAMKPTGAFMDGSGNLLFVTDSTLFRCDGTGQGCQQIALPFGDATGLAVASSGRVIVVSYSGDIALCDGGSCTRAGGP